MIPFAEYISEGKIKWVKKPDGQQGNKKVFKHVSSDGKWEISLSGKSKEKFDSLVLISVN